MLIKSINIDTFIYIFQARNKLFLSFRRKYKVRSILKINAYPVKGSGWSRQYGIGIRNGCYIINAICFLEKKHHLNFQGIFIYSIPNTKKRHRFHCKKQQRDYYRNPRKPDKEDWHHRQYGNSINNIDTGTDF